MGGEMGVRSTAGEGSTFWFTFAAPVGTACTIKAEKPAETAAPRQREEEVRREVRGAIRVLVAEDNEINQVVAREVLERGGFACEVVRDGAAALDALTREAYDVVLMDCQMPIMDGFEATAEIRRRGMLSRSGQPVPVIALTASAIQGDRERCEAAGMSAYLTKPLDPKTVIQTIQGIVGTVATDGGEEAPLDLAELRARCMGNEELVARVLAAFQENLPKQLAQLEGDSSGVDRAALGRVAHAIKGVAATLAAHGLQGAAASLDGAAVEGQSADELAARVEGVRAEAERLTQWLRRGAPLEQETSK
jgi:Amt family ammonium transporter